MENTKRCSKCRKEKSAEEFGKYKQCVSCVSYCKEYSRNNADKRNEYAKDYIERRKEMASEKIYCSDCKMEIQHGSWSQHIKSKGHLWNTGKDCKEFDDKQKWMTCPVCNNYPIQCKNYKRHLTTALHKENLNKLNQ